MRQVGNTIVDKVHLTVAAHLEVYCLGNNLGRESVHLGLYGIAVGRRRLDYAQVARTHQRELQCAGDRRGTHGESVDRGLHLAQFLFGRHAELLLLVDDEQAQVLELYRLADQSVGADDDIYLAISQILEDG